MTLLFLSFMQACYMRTLYVKKRNRTNLFSIVCVVFGTREIVFPAIVPIGSAHLYHAFGSTFWSDTCSSSTAVDVRLGNHGIIIERSPAPLGIVALDASCVRPQAKPACPRFYTKCRVHRHIHSLDIRGVMFSVQRYIFSTNHQHSHIHTSTYP